MINYINNTFGIKFKIEEIKKVQGFPIFMTAERKFYKLENEEITFFLVEISNSEKFGSVALEKQLMKYENVLNMPVCFSFQYITKSMRDSLIKKKIPFVEKDKQLYLPFLGILFNNHFSKNKRINNEKMMPITQLLFLYMIYHCKGKKILKKDAAERIGVTKTSITRASNQLIDMGLIEEEIVGKNTYIWIKESSKTLFEKAKDYMINPIQKEIVIEKSDIPDRIILSGESALADFTMLNKPKLLCVAVHKSILKNCKLKEIDEQWSLDNNLVRVQFWKYDPILLSKDGMADPISLYMTFKSNKDERIEEALDEYMEVYRW